MSLITVGEVIDRSWHHYTKHFVELMSVAAWLLIVAILNTLATWLYPQMNYGIPTDLSGIDLFSVILYAVNFLLIAPVVSIWVFNTTVLLIDRESQNGQIRLKELGRKGWKKFFPRVLVGILGILCVASPILLVLPGALLSFAATTIVPGLGVIATILFVFGIFAATAGMIFLLIRLIFSAYELLLSDQHGRKALRASWKLTADRWWPVFWRVVLPKVIFFFGMFTVQLFLTFLLRMLATNVAGLNFELGVRIYTIGSGLIFILLGALLNPLVLTSDYLVYKSLKEERS